MNIILAPKVKHRSLDTETLMRLRGTLSVLRGRFSRVQRKIRNDSDLNTSSLQFDC